MDYLQDNPTDEYNRMIMEQPNQPNGNIQQLAADHVGTVPSIVSTGYQYQSPSMYHDRQPGYIGNSFPNTNVIVQHPPGYNQQVTWNNGWMQTAMNNHPPTGAGYSQNDHFVGGNSQQSNWSIEQPVHSNCFASNLFGQAPSSQSYYNYPSSSGQQFQHYGAFNQHIHGHAAGILRPQEHPSYLIHHGLNAINPGHNNWATQGVPKPKERLVSLVPLAPTTPQSVPNDIDEDAVPEARDVPRVQVQQVVERQPPRSQYYPAGDATVPQEGASTSTDACITTDSQATSVPKNGKKGSLPTNSFKLRRDLTQKEWKKMTAKKRHTERRKRKMVELEEERVEKTNVLKNLEEKLIPAVSDIINQYRMHPAVLAHFPDQRQHNY